MTVRLLDTETGDIVTSGEQFANGADEVVQTVKTRLRLFLGEYFRDVKNGTPWYQSILGKQGTLSSKETILKSRIIRTEGVVSILEFNTKFDLATRKYSVTAVIMTKYGVTEFGINSDG